MLRIKIMRDGKWMEAEIGMRTLNILRALEKWGIMGLAQVEGLLFTEGLDEGERMSLFFNSKFEGEYSGASYKAVKSLEGLGLIEVQSYINMPRLYNLTKEGHRVLRNLGLNKLNEIRGPLADSMVKHEALVTGIGAAISEFLGRPVSTEFERQVMSRGAAARPMGAAKTQERESFPLPDLWVSDPDQPKAIEVERTQKSAKRYRKLWAFYRGNIPSKAVVLYIAAFPNGPRLLLARARKLLASFIYVCGLEDFQKSLGTCPFVNYRGGQIRLEKRPGHPQFPHYQRVPFAPPRQSERIGELIRTASRPDQSAPPLEMREFPRPHPLTPSPTPEGDGPLRGELR